jgi:hypothetical protein
MQWRRLARMEGSPVQIDYVKGSNIISLESRTMEGHFPAVNEVEGYWTALASTGIPQRAKIDPRGIENALHNAFVLERIAPTVARFRLAGMHLSDLMGMEVRGMPLTALFLPESRTAIGQALDRAFDAPARVTLVLAGERGVGRGPLDARMVLLPLLDDGGRVTRVLGALEARGQIGRQPRRFSLVESRVATLAAPLQPAQPAAAEPVRGMAEPAPQVFTHNQRPYLRLVRSDE